MKTFRKTFRKSFIKKKLLGKASAKETFGESFIKAQSAMEYLMTYGWAILIISVVLAALFQLGVFNPMTFAPKAPPGSCQVFRPNGPGTTSFINLEGVCTGELPQYVGGFNGNGRIGINPATWSQSIPLTISFWVNPATFQSYYRPVTSGSNSYRAWSFYFNTGSPNIAFEFLNQSGMWSINGGPLSVGQWSYVTAVVTSSTQKLYINGALVSSDGISITSFNPNALSWFGIGAWGDGSGDYFYGSVANVQIYNISLSANEIQALYLEGIGGAPINLQHLIGWWPLNGNANDYSGNGNNGQIFGNVNFVSNWYSGYTPP